MQNATCPYCHADVSLEEVEKEGGLCPECGSPMGGSSVLDADDEDDLLDDDLDDDL